MIGRTIAHYKVLEKLGQGGMGEVYLAEDTKLHRKVALKFLPDALTNDPEARERLIREARAASQLSHPNIVTVHVIDEHNGRDFIVMEYVAGAAAHEYCREHGCGLNEILGIVIGIANGLARAHESGIVHRDLKPSNVLIEKDGRARILDFGLAKTAGLEKLTKSGTTLGTVAYMSPEQGRGEDTDHRSDIFSLGVLLYELITGQQPFEGGHEAAVIYATANENPEPLARYKKDVPDELQRIVSKCLAKRPQERYQTAADLVTDLKGVKRQFTDPSQAALSTSMAAPARRPLWQGMLVMIGIAVVGVALFVVLRGRQQTQVSDRTEDAKSLVVLPFENVGASEDEYFADGITDEITSRLAGIGGLRVISPASAIQFKGATISPREIGEKLGVNYILAGTIRWDKSGDTNRVRITPQLIQVHGEFSIWSEIYERAITRIFAVQSDIAGHIANELDVALEGGTPQASPTEDLNAYDYYLRGKEYLRNEPTEADARTAISLFEKAIAIDPDFAEPYAGIGVAVFSHLWFMTSKSRQELSERAEKAIEQALILAPKMPSAHLAKGYFYNWHETDYDHALEEFSRALELGNKDSETYHAIAWVQMRQGNWADAEVNLHNALAHDPLSVDVLGTLTDLYIELRRFDDAMTFADRALSIAPDKGESYVRKAILLLSRDADTAAAGVVIRDGIARLNSTKFMGISRGPLSFSGGFLRWRFVDITPALVRASFVQTTLPGDRLSELYELGVAFDQHGQRDSAIACYDSLIAGIHRALASDPFEVFDQWAHLGLFSMLAGYTEDAYRFANTSVEKMSIESCHW